LGNGGGGPRDCCGEQVGDVPLRVVVGKQSRIIQFYNLLPLRHESDESILFPLGLDETSVPARLLPQDSGSEI
jgi:hypothetical protein